MFGDHALQERAGPVIGRLMLKALESKQNGSDHPRRGEQTCQENGERNLKRTDKFCSSTAELHAFCNRPANRQDEFWFERIRFELGAQAIDVGGDGVLIAVMRVAPTRVKQLGAGEHVPGMLSEVQKQVKLQCREIHRFALHLNQTFDRQNLEIAVPQ